MGAKSKVAVRELVIFGLFLGVSLSACTPRAGLFPALESDTPSTVATPQTDQPPEWELYTDSETSVSFSYPSGWQKQTRAGKSVELVKWNPHYRVIRLEIYKNEEHLSAHTVAEQHLAKIAGAYGEDQFSQVQISPYEKSGVEAVQLTSFPDNLVSAFVITHGEISLWITLTEGSDIQGLASDAQTILADKQILYQIVDTIDFSPRP